MADVVVITNVGVGLTTGRMKGSSNEPKYLGWGTGSTPPVAGNTVLETPAAEARTSGTSSQSTTTITNDTYQVIAIIYCAGAVKTISEIGLFDASTDGNLYLRATFTGVPLSVGDGIQFTAKVKHANA